MPAIFLYIEEQQAGPYEPNQVRQFLTEGKITAETPAWHEALAEWSTVGQVLAAFPLGASAPPAYVPPPPAPAPLVAAPAKKGLSGCALAAIVVGVVGFLGIFVVAILAGIAIGPITKGIEKAKENMSMQQARMIDLGMFAYANDHGGKYPTGKTSTEVFQQLLDGKYVAEPTTFYTFMSGKLPASSNKLTAENVCFDVTSGVTADSSDFVPMVFLTGFTVSYTPGASAKRNADADTGLKGMAVAYKSNSAIVRKIDADGTVLGFIPDGFTPGNNTYEQLRP